MRAAVAALLLSVAGCAPTALGPPPVVPEHSRSAPNSGKPLYEWLDHGRVGGAGRTAAVGSEIFVGGIYAGVGSWGMTQSKNSDERLLSGLLIAHGSVFLGLALAHGVLVPSAEKWSELDAAAERAEPLKLGLAEAAFREEAKRMAFTRQSQGVAGVAILVCAAGMIALASTSDDQSVREAGAVLGLLFVLEGAVATPALFSSTPMEDAWKAYSAGSRR